MPVNTHISTISKRLLVEELMALVGRASAYPPAYRARLERMDAKALARLREELLDAVDKNSSCLSGRGGA